MPDHVMIKYLPAFICLLLFSCVYHDLSTEDPVGPEVCDPAMVSWQRDILPIMVKACATAGCHDGISRRDWTDYREVSHYAEEIKKRTIDRSMPFDETLPEREIALITCWVEGGALNN